ncbi:MAG: DUF2474 family protein [Acetobacter indonesiensis]|jgi:hypothetical protein|nr:DUF2474 family protein [Acetobacter indonesiensis]MCI1545751.1 DUF2474 family protein [Acetobacter indonesiensis]MCI1765375.1 DUF2474 family protein [Acetobacter indonesiensis]
MQTVEQPLWRKLAWFLALWVAGVLALGVVAGVLKLVIHN